MTFARKAGWSLPVWLALAACEAQTTSVGSYDPPITIGHPVDSSEITLQSVTLFGPIPVFGALTGYAADESSAARASEPPLYAPYDSSDPAWWDELVAEQSQARVHRVLFPTRGASSLDAADTSGPGNMNPRRLTAWIDALTRAGSTGLFEAGCFVDTAFLPALANAVHSTPTGTPFDLAVQSDWNDIVWLRMIKPWFDTMPSSYWWTLDDDTPGGRGPAVIQFAAIDAAAFSNTAGNVRQLLEFIATQFTQSYGSAPVFVLDASWFALEPSVQQLASVIGENPYFSAPATANAFMPYQGKSFGTVVAGFVDPSHDDPASPSYHSASVVIPRKLNANSATTLQTGLEAASASAAVTLLPGFTDYTDCTGLYRSQAWDFPNQYLNLLRRYSDPRTVTVRLEAEGCDRFADTTAGNSGGVFRRSGDLDVRALASGSGWAVTNTAAGEWIEFDAVDFSSGNYEFIANDATTDGSSASSPPSKLVQLAIDGKALPPTRLPGSATADSFNADFLGQATLSHGPHDLRLTFIDGQVELDWLFLKKTDPLITLQTSAGMFVSAIQGGNGVLQGSIPRASIYENFSCDDLNGGDLEDGDHVNLQSYDGYYLIGDPSAGTLLATARAPDPGAAFIIESLSGTGAIGSGQSVALRTASGGRYLTVGADASQTLDVTGVSVGDAQTFVIGLGPQ